MIEGACVDASFSLKLVLFEEGSDRARAKMREWIEGSVVVISPLLWLFECQSALRRKAYRGLLTGGQAREAWDLLQKQGIESVLPPDLFERAWSLAARLRRPTTYDCVYLATAEARGCGLWTADVRLAGAVGTKLPWVHLV